MESENISNLTEKDETNDVPTEEKTNSEVLNSGQPIQNSLDIESTVTDGDNDGRSMENNVSNLKSNDEAAASAGVGRRTRKRPRRR